MQWRYERWQLRPSALGKIYARLKSWFGGKDAKQRAQIKEMRRRYPLLPKDHPCRDLYARAFFMPGDWAEGPGDDATRREILAEMEKRVGYFWESGASGVGEDRSR